MRILLILLLVVVAPRAFAQTSFLKDAVAKLDKALITKDTVTLKQLLHPQLTYGHSNGWIQAKADVVNDLRSGKLSYSKIDSRDFNWAVSGDVVTLRSSSDVGYTLDGKQGELKLHVVQVWVKQNGRWQLFARQSTKL